MNKKNTLLITMIILVLACLAGFCVWHLATRQPTRSSTVVDQLPETEPVVNLPNPIVEYPTLAAAINAVGFSLDDQEDLLSTYQPSYSVIDNRILQIAYHDDLQTITLRKALADNEDISGDYNIYQKNALATLGEENIAATLRGDDGMISSAYWQLGDYSYSLHADLPLTPALAQDIILAVK